MTNTQKLLKAYLDHYRYDPGISKGDNQLFTNQKKGKLSRWGISYIINKYVRQAKESGLLDIDFPVDAACIPPQQSCPYGEGRDKSYLHT